MRKPDLSGVGSTMEAMVKKHGPEILTGLGTAGMVVTTILAVQATPKALRLLEAKQQELETEKLTPVQAVQAAWLCYIPAAATGMLSILCLVCASSAHGRRNAALATAYSLSESALKEYREKVVETIGKKKEQSIQDAVAKEQISRNPVGNNEVILTGKGHTLCFDVVSGRYFESDVDKLRRAENTINRQMISDMFVSLNEFYDELGLGHISVGDDLGWNIERGFLELRFSTQLSEDETPCLVVNYQVVPEYDYR